MIKAELSYNPYILESKALFNGKEPHANSAIKKYEKERLQDWINEVPYVFYQELNGYDFQINFSGTKLEFNELKKVFEKSVPKELYKLEHCKILGSRRIKLDMIKKTLQWLQDTECEYFNYEEFCLDHNNLVDVHYPLFIINGNENDVIGLEELNVSAEYIDDLKDLEETNLRFAPFIIYITENGKNEIQKQLFELRDRKKVNDLQLFFILRDNLKEKNIERFLQDLGIENPIIVDKPNDDKVYDYLNAYPITQHIYEVCEVFEIEAEKISKELVEEKKRIESDSSEKYSLIENLSGRLEKIRQCKTRFNNRSRLYRPIEWSESSDLIIKNINRFKENNVMIIGSEAAEKAANNYQQEVAKNLVKFFSFVDKSTDQLLQKLQNEYRLMYLESGIEDSFEPKIDKNERNQLVIPDFRLKLLNSKIERIVEEKSIFAAKDEPPKKVLRKEYPLSNWRKIVCDEISKVISKITEDYYGEITNYADCLSEGYLEHLSLIEKGLSNDKAIATDSLSENEKKLDRNLNWMLEFFAQIMVIEEREIANEKTN